MTRKLILENIQEAIKDKVLPLDYIFINRGIDSDIEELPLININSQSEQVTIHNESPRTYRRNLAVSVECNATGDDFKQAYEVLESMIEATEQLIEVNTFLNGLDRTTILSRIEYDFEANAEIPVASATLFYNVERLVDARDYDKDCFDILKQVNIDWKILDNTPENVVDAEDIIDDLET